MKLPQDLQGWNKIEERAEEKKQGMWKYDDEDEND